MGSQCSHVVGDFSVEGMWSLQKGPSIESGQVPQPQAHWLPSGPSRDSACGSPLVPSSLGPAVTQEASQGWEHPKGPSSAASHFSMLVTKADWLRFCSNKKKKKCIDFGLLPMIQEKTAESIHIFKGTFLLGLRLPWVLLENHREGWRESRPGVRGNGDLGSCPALSVTLG